MKSILRFFIRFVLTYGLRRILVTLLVAVVGLRGIHTLVGYIQNRPVTLDWDGDIVFVSKERVDSLHVRLMNSSSMAHRPLFGPAQVGSAPLAVAPGGETLVYSDGGRLFVFAGEASTILCQLCYAPRWSPSGRYLVYVQDQLRVFNSPPQTLDIVIARWDEERAEAEIVLRYPIADTPSSTSGHYAIRPSWSRDEQFLVFARADSDENWGLWLQAVGAETPAVFLTPGSQADWSPSRDEILFVQDEKIWLLDLHENRQTLLVDDTARLQWPVWSPDGNQLVFVRHDQGDFDLWGINRDGSEMHKLTRSRSRFERFPEWRRGR